MSGAVDEFVVEVAPNVLKFVRACSTPELAAAALLLVLADDVPDTVWAGRFQVVQAALQERCDPRRGGVAARRSELVVAGMRELPEDLRQPIARRVHAGLRANQERDECR